MHVISSEIKNLQRPLLLSTPYGDVTIHEPILIDLIKSPSMQRLKEIDQYGITAYITSLPSFSRYDHSIGVLVLLRKYGCSLHEQIAGLLHDVSHTVFSHVADVIFKQHSEKNSYQDDIHEWFIGKTELATILKNHGFAVKDILHKQKTYKALERDIPYLCADRIEYNLHGALVEKLLTKKDIKKIIQSLHLQDGIWFFTEIEQARKLAKVSLYLQQYAYTSPASCLVYHWMGKVMQRALEIEFVSMNDIHFSTDILILDKIKKSDDAIIKNLVQNIKNHEKLFTIGSSEKYDLNLPVKFRGLDPLIKINNELKPLTDLDKTFAQEFKNAKLKMVQGWHISLKE